MIMGAQQEIQRKHVFGSSSILRENLFYQAGADVIHKPPSNVFETLADERRGLECCEIV